MTHSARRQVLKASAATMALGATGIRSARAQQQIRLTIGSSLPLAMAWTAPAPTLFMQEVNRRLEAAKSEHTIRWQDSWGGALFKPGAGAQAVGQGVVDIGFVWSNIEGSRFPLHQLSLVTPYSTDNCVAIGETMMELHEKFDVMRSEWTQHNITLLGATTVDTYHLYTKMPIRSLADLRGKRISAVGAIGLWIKETGAVHVNGNLGTWYTDVQTGVADGAIIMATGAAMIKIWEVAPFLTLLGMGAHNNGGPAINNDTLKRLPPDVASVIRTVGREYTRRSAEAVMAKATADLQLARELSSKQSVPLTITDFTGAEKQQLVASTPDLAGDWVKANEGKAPARQIMRAYMDGLRARGAKPLRNWA